MGVGRTRFQSGLRVTREHLDHLQDVLLDAVHHARESTGTGRVIFGLRVELDGEEAVVGPGAAVDRRARLLSSPAEKRVKLTDGYLVVRHRLRSEGVVRGVPTLLFDEAVIEPRTELPEDDAVVFARVEHGVVTQRGDWYLPPLAHRHSGAFVERDGRWRYDGDPLGLPPARFDSGWVDEDDVTLRHELAGEDLVVQLQARRRGAITVEALGSAYWYELPDADHIRLVRKTEKLELRVVAWPLALADGPPVADPGPDLLVAPGESFTLDGHRSRASGDRRIVKFIWTGGSAMSEFVIGEPVVTEEPGVEVTIDPRKALPAGRHTFTLVVVDDSGNESKPAEVVVVVRDDQAPTAVIKAPSQVGFGKSFKLDGSASADLPPGKITKYIWTLRE
jgi:hypothetical protein